MHLAVQGTKEAAVHVYRERDYHWKKQTESSPDIVSTDTEALPFLFDRRIHTYPPLKRQCIYWFEREPGT